MLPLSPRNQAAPPWAGSESQAARGLPRHRSLRRPRLTVEGLLLLGSAWFLLSANGRFLAAALAGRPPGSASTWGFALALGAGIFALHLLLMLPLASRMTAKPLLALLIVASALAGYYMGQYGVYLDPTMMRNVLHTDWREARELLAPSLWLHLAVFAGAPLLLLWRIELEPMRVKRAVARRLALAAAAIAVLALALLSIFQPLASLMRNQRELRYLVTPANIVWSMGSVGAGDARAHSKARRVIGQDARPGPSWASSTKPRLLVLVVGETVRSANWGLSGYERQTTPELAQLAREQPLLNFASVKACGTNTETSLPCMFAAVGRRDYDEATIRGSQSLLHVLARAGVGVTWRDNQSGCKGVCEGLPTQSVRELGASGGTTSFCTDGQCLDEGLLHGLPEMLKQLHGTQLLVLHMLGNHGPAYFRRYPPAYARFQPACQSDDLGRCTTAEIVNAYDNALLYTDHLLAQLIRTLQAQAASVDSAVVFVSDHGESLGESKLFLHGLPYAIAPDVQKQVPMLMWFSKGFASDRGLDLACLRDRSRLPAAHDHLFHTLLGLLDVRTSLYAPDWDLSQGCRSDGVEQ
ncbi:MAG TPA: phosphoethanolamine--lipid A transferase [Rubrivivax sp.]|nr:phosphoethanolamine--lipid A transferase [Rubrivivax sp.]